MSNLLGTTVDVSENNNYFTNTDTTVYIPVASDSDKLRDKIKCLNKIVKTLAKDLDLDVFDKEFQNNVDSILEDCYNDNVKDHELYINSLKQSIIECKSKIDKIKSLGGVAGKELMKSYNDFKSRLAIAKNIKEKELK